MTAAPAVVALLLSSAGPLAERRPLHFALGTAPAGAYGRAHRSEADRDLAAIVADLKVVRYDPALARAAREVAIFHAREKDVAPSDVLCFLLAAAGAAEWGVQQAALTLSPGSDREVRETVRELAESFPPGSPPIRVGLGETLEPGPPPRRHVAVLISASGLDLEPVPATSARDAHVVVRFRLPALWDRPEVMVLTPGLDLHSVAVTGDATGYRAEVDTGPKPGVLFIEFLANGPGGPSPLAQIEIHVDEPPPREYRGHWPPDESRIRSHDEAADLVYRLLGEDRQAAGLPPLARDPALDAIARAHSRDMRDRGFVGHVSPATGPPASRLAAAGYRSIAHAENVARDGSLYEAEERLLASLGHRRNILSNTMTRVGIGLSLAVQEGERVWYLTQLFARPARAIDRAVAETQALDAIGRARAARGLRPLSLDRAFSALAQAEAERPAPSPRRVLDELRADGRRDGTFWSGVITLPEMEQFVVPEPALGPGYARLGIGIYQDLTLDSPEIRLVLLTGE